MKICSLLSRGKVSASSLTMTAVLLVAPTVVLPVGAQTVKNIYSFTGQNASGLPEFVIPAQGRDGKLYGTTFGPSNGSSGSIFKVTTAGVETNLYTFGSDGSNPTNGLTLASDGNFYGTTPLGGASNDGVLFRVAPDGAYAVLHEFAGGSDGASPFAPPVEASDGSLYGTTSGTSGASTVYRYTHGGTFSTIYNFDQAHGQYAASLIQGTDGKLYGTAQQGGASACGTIFKLATSGSLLWTYSFPCGAGGAFPVTPLLQATDGNFYGTTNEGGSKLNLGTIFKLDPSGNVSILYTFKTLRTDGGFPSSLIQGTDGNLYETGSTGGTFNQGVLFQITTSGTYSVLYSFYNQGRQPVAPPLQHTNGLFYGTTNLGGYYSNGSVYSLNMGLGPFVTFVRAIGRVGQTVEILGQGFTGTTGVTFNSVAATAFTVVHDTYMTAVVPTGATTGPVVVTTPTGTLTSNKNFTIR